MFSGNLLSCNWIPVQMECKKTSLIHLKGSNYCTSPVEFGNKVRFKYLDMACPGRLLQFHYRQTSQKLAVKKSKL